MSDREHTENFHLKVSQPPPSILFLSFDSCHENCPFSFLSKVHLFHSGFCDQPRKDERCILSVTSISGHICVAGHK